MCAIWAYVTKLFVVVVIIIIIVTKKIKSLQVIQMNVFDGASLYNINFEVSLEDLRKTCKISEVITCLRASI
jgi:hypothetical protein